MENILDEDEVQEYQELAKNTPSDKLRSYAKKSEDIIRRSTNKDTILIHREVAKIYYTELLSRLGY